MNLKKIKKIIKILLSKDNSRSYERFMNNSSSFFQPSFAINAPLIGDRKCVYVGEDCVLECKIYFETQDGNVKFGNNVYVGNSTIICRSNVTFEDNIFVAWGCCFYDHDSHSLSYLERRNDLTRQIDDLRNGRNFIASKDWSVVSTKPIHICSDAWIGMNVIVLKGVRIGKGAVVAAGSVVTKDVPDWTVVAGNPAKVVKHLEIKE